ncbi:WxL domain-containing protein [Enterococcus sp. AZ007]|uniref:WxL domain-containing protein n=1 Tax=Enterococcus sp. AZ007 TaxID=2774839 RepID=UPI003F25ED41
MNINRIGKTTALLLLLGSLTAPASLVQAKTYEDVPTAESSILSRTADPIQVSQERLKRAEIEDSEDKTEESTKETEITESSEEKEKESTDDETKESSTESSTETTDSSKEKNKKKQPRATVLKEGTYGVNDPSSYDIDDLFVDILRNNYTATHWPPPNIPGTFIGYGGTPMTEEYLSTLNQFNGTSTKLKSLKGIEYAGDTLSAINVAYAYLEDIDLSQNTQVIQVGFNGNKVPLPKLDLSKNVGLSNLQMASSGVKEVDVSHNYNLQHLMIQNNLAMGTQINTIKKIDLSNNAKLLLVYAQGNQIRDISSANGLTNLVNMNFSDQTIYVPIPKIDDGKATVDILKTTAQSGLTVTNGDISGVPILSANGDKIILENVTKESLDGKYLNFSYDGTKLVEGKSGGSKFFSGKIYFSTTSDLEHSLKVDTKKVDNNSTVGWTWKLKNLTAVSADNIEPELTLPSGLALVSGSVKIDGSTVSDNVLSGGTNLGSLSKDQEKKITFETTATGTVGTWLEAKGNLKWDDSISEGTTNYDEDRLDKVQIKDGEQTYTPKPSEEMGILSVPVRFDYGIKDMSNTTQSFGLSPDLYQTNTNVVTNGFYTRVKDDRSTSTGWSLTAQLSSFVDVNDNSRGMPDSHGTALRLEDMSIEAIKDRDTPDEAVDPAPASPQPGTVKSSETIVAGQSAKTLVSAQPYTGQGTWQLRIPFNKVFLDLPANAGKERSNFQAKLTWSLNDTP